MYSLSETITTADPLAASRYSQSLNNALAQGHGNAEAAQLATNSLYTTLQQQSLLLALKNTGLSAGYINHHCCCFPFYSVP